MPSPSHSPFGEILSCPVCMEVFDGRIMQCSQGHAVCEQCQSKLTECPHCRGVYVGTRNYILEEVIAKLKRLSSTNSISFNENDNEHRPDSAEPRSTNEAPPQAAILDTTTTPLRLFAPSGQYDCRMLSCETKLPICRLLNHLRYFHKESLTEIRRVANANDNGDFIDHWDLPCASFRKVFNLQKFGIFFLIGNVTRVTDSSVDRTTIKAWVQAACSNRFARNFRFSLELIMGDTVATFTDYVVGGQSDADYIQSNKNCLSVDTTNVIEWITVEMKISRNLGAQSLPRNDRTDCRILPVSQQVQRIRIQEPPSPPRPHVRSRRNRRR